MKFSTDTQHNDMSVYYLQQNICFERSSRTEMHQLRRKNHSVDIRQHQRYVTDENSGANSSILNVRYDAS